MTIKNRHETRPNRTQREEPVVNRQEDTTQVGQVIQNIGRLTEHLKNRQIQWRPPVFRQHVTPAPERIATLIESLGDPQHPEHVKAVDALVEIGSPAVPALCEALEARHSWLTSYRAAEALGYIGDGSATGALIQTLHHPNSNVRWSAVRALSHIGDLRAIFELRRIAHHDHGRTSWGESVAGTAQSALDQMRARSLLGQGLELIKTAITSVMMILALVLAFSVFTTLRTEMEHIGDVNAVDINAILPQPAENAEPDASEDAAAPLTEPTPTPEPAPTATPRPTPVVRGTVLQGANVRPLPSTQNQPVGELNQGDEIVFVGRTTNGDWYLVRLGERHSDSSFIDNPDGSSAGWVNEALLSRPEGEVAVEDPFGTDAESDADDAPDVTPTP